MSDITLTSGIRQNLLSLQQTSADLTTTQEALATGKAVIRRRLIPAPISRRRI